MENPRFLKTKSSSLVWDCDSTLYDSFELNSFKRQLDSAIASRTLSMPHLSDRRTPPLPPPSKRPSKISRSLQKLLRSVFRQKSDSSSSPSFESQEPLKLGFYVSCTEDKKIGSLSAIPEVEFGGFSPEISSLVRRTVSERFTASSIGISCA